MAQRDKELTLPETIAPPMCANNCGFPADPSTNNMCQTCFLASRSAPSSIAAAGRPQSQSSPQPSRLATSGESQTSIEIEVVKPATSPAPTPSTAAVNRCKECKKKVGLVGGFRCRCGVLFCGSHRYSDRHDCGFDYKAAARVAIERENPIVRAAKIVRI